MMKLGNAKRISANSIRPSLTLRNVHYFRSLSLLKQNRNGNKNRPLIMRVVYVSAILAIILRSYIVFPLLHSVFFFCVSVDIEAGNRIEK